MNPVDPGASRNSWLWSETPEVTWQRAAGLKERSTGLRFSSMKYLISIDVSTCCERFCSAGGDKIIDWSEAYPPIMLTRPREQDPELWWHALVKSLRRRRAPGSDLITSRRSYLSSCTMVALDDRSRPFASPDVDG
jgi:hypothetical protein